MALRRTIAGYPCTETFLLGRLWLDTRPGLTRWRVAIHVSSASHLYPHWALGSHLPDTRAICDFRRSPILTFALLNTVLHYWSGRYHVVNPSTTGLPATPPPTGPLRGHPAPRLLTTHA